jgi:hypothetical protein
MSLLVFAYDDGEAETIFFPTLNLNLVQSLGKALMGISVELRDRMDPQFLLTEFASYLVTFRDDGVHARYAAAIYLYALAY